MATLIFLTGAGLVLVVLYDFLRTTISMTGLGPISARITYGLWRAARSALPGVEQRLGMQVRGFVGPGILVAIAAAWVGLHLAGYTLMYAAGVSLEASDTGLPASLIDKTAFAGSALSTLGASTVQPTNGWWDLLSVLAAVNGMIVLTLSVSFILTILQTTAAARTFAARAHALLGSAEGGSPGHLEAIAPLGPAFCELAVNLKAAPLPGVFVPTDPALDFPSAILKIVDVLRRSGDQISDDPAPHAELRAALRLLGDRVSNEGGDGLAATFAWARQHHFDDA